MLLRNDLLRYTHPSARTVRILWIAADQSLAYVFDVAARSADVERVSVPALLADIGAGRASILAQDPYLVVVSGELLPAKHLQLRARAWEIVEPLVALEPDIYEARRRGQLVADATALHGVSHPTIYRYLRRYWQRGQTPNALLPDYGNSGGKGKVRQSSAGVKRGRPRKNGADAGLNADEEIRRVFRVATAYHAATRNRFSRLGAYQQMLAEFFGTRHIDAESGRVLMLPRPAAPLPTFGQFNYWLDHDDDRPPEVARRAAARIGVWTDAQDAQGAPSARGAPDGAPFVPPAAPPAGRPGAGFYLDAVRAEVQLVSRADRHQAIGRPLVYIAVDSFSRMVTGVYVGMGPPSWPQAMLALANCGADKQRYSQRFGRAIETAQWPCRHLPETLFVNAALTCGWNGDTLLNNFNLRCVAAEDGPGEWKTVLEKRFRLLPPGAEGEPCRLDGVLDLDQFTRIVIDAILYHNAHQALPDAGGVTPRRLWNWGVEQRGGALKTCPEQLLRCSLMPVAPAAVTADGLRLFDGRYTCAQAVAERWFERARLRGGWDVKVAYDPADLDVVYLLDPAAPMRFHPCQLADSASVRRHLSAAEIARLPGAGAASSASPSVANATATSARGATIGYSSFVN